MLKGGDSGKAIVPGDPASSRLVQAVSYKHELKMPPTGKLTDEQIADLEAWVKMGAPDPRTGDAPAQVAKKGIDFTEARKFWAFHPVQRPAIPAVKNKRSGAVAGRCIPARKTRATGIGARSSSGKTSVDPQGDVRPDRTAPNPGRDQAFVDDKSPDAFKKVVERLLASPHYGERWARHWLDLVRYAETNGHEYDNDKWEPWRYRDYVIRSFNEDIPYDQFVREHIAGDLLPTKRVRKDGGASSRRSARRTCGSTRF